MPICATGPKGPKVYLVAVHDYVVAQDLSDAVRDFDPAAVVVTARSCREALMAVREAERVALAFIEAGPDRVAQARLDVAIRNRGGALVLLGDEAEAQCDTSNGSAPRWKVLIRPFSGQTVTEYLKAARPLESAGGQVA